ncbi:MAG: hypothetical protein DMD79_03890 [Candidatus Rokuibacteriota bacterium]|nr:MAG: hypothetical protein DMD79_03890 [Candidatus Rokubacteria bacterium]
MSHLWRADARLDAHARRHVSEIVRSRILENQLRYHDLTTAIPLDTFVQYGQSFQQRLVPYLERRLVTSVDRSANGQGYALRLDDDEVVTARRVVIATGMSGFQYVPPVLAGLPPDSLSHTSDHHDLTQFRGRDVSVMGRGSSALDVAALLHHDAGAKVRIVARRAPLIGLPPVEHPPLRNRVRRPLSRLGTGWWLLLCAEAPMLFRFLPASARSHLVRTTLGPAGGWHLQDRIVGHIPIDIGTVQHAERRATVRARSSLTTSSREPATKSMSVDCRSSAAVFCPQYGLSGGRPCYPGTSNRPCRDCISSG